jgi:hypothetical protein
MSSVYTIYNIKDEDFIEIIKTSTTWTEIIRRCGYNGLGNNKTILKRCQKLNIDISHLPSGQGDNRHQIGKNKKIYTIEQILVEKSTYNNGTRLKKRLIKEKGFEYKCYNCNLTEWMGKPIPLDLEHKNGIHTDNRIENLTFLCCNCHALTDTYKGKNVKHKIIPDENKCKKCDKILSHKTSSYCNKCINIVKRKVERPSYEELLEQINNKVTKIELGKKYGVSDGTIGDWIKYYEKELNENL